MTGEEFRRFQEAREKVIGKDRERNGIGTLSEKTVHAVLKEYYAPDPAMQEVPVAGCVADICTGSEIVEIQTRGFHRLRPKLERFLPLFPVTVVYPIPLQKTVHWVDPQTGEISGGRKSPLKGSPYLAFPELYRIKPFLKDPNLRIRLPFLNMEEYKLLDGWSRDKKRGSSRYDRIPVSLEYEVEFACPRDYLRLIPYDLKEPFTSAQFAKAVRIRRELSGTVLNVLAFLGAAEVVGKEGRAYLYRAKE